MMATTYQLQVSTVNTFATTVYDQSLLTTVAPYVDGLSKGTTYYWRVRATVDLVEGVWSTTFSFTVAASTLPIWEQIINDLKTAIAAMSVGGGYNFDYSTVDNRVQARTYPAVLLSFPEAEGVLGDGLMVNKIATGTDVTFTVIFSSTETATSRDDAIDKGVDDLKRLFNAQLNSLQAAGLIDYDFKGEERRYTLTPARPAEVDVIFGLNWRQSRITPTST